MAYSAVPTISTGDVATASWGNTYIKDNFAAGVPDLFTADGEVAIGTGANAGEAVAILDGSNRLKHEYGGLEFNASGVVLSDLLKGSGTGTIAILTKGTGNQVLTMNAGATDFTWADAPVIVKQMVFTITGALATGTTIIPINDTIPQITEGDEYMTLAITPQSTNNRLVIQVSLSLHHTVLNIMAAALFRDAINDALAAANTHISVAAQEAHLTFTHIMTAPSTSSQTYRVRAGGNLAGTTWFNGSYALGTRIYGGIMASSIVIWEVGP